MQTKLFPNARRRALLQATGAADFRSTLSGYGLAPIGGSSATFRQFLADDARAWSQVIRAHHITVDS